MRLAAVGFEPGALGVAQTQRGAVIDRRAAERLLALAPAVELLRRLIGRVEQAQRLQFSARGVVKGHPLRLAADKIGLDAEPGEILLDRAGIFGRERSTSVSSNRRTNVPPVRRANSQFSRAVRAFPM